MENLENSQEKQNISAEEIELIKEEKIIPKCGIVMPISAIDNCTAEHWAEVLIILKDCIKTAEFEPFLVSDADDSGIIQKRIVQNLYSNEIVVCDVSAKNPNVMFELGLRLAFDKPTIIIKDDKTDYTFDTSIIEHLTYPRDLRFSRIINFKDALRKKIIATYEKSKNDPNYTTFLKHFGEYKVANLNDKEVSSEKFIISAIEDLREEISMMRRIQRNEISHTPVSKFSIANALFDKKNYVKDLFDEYKNLNDIDNNFVFILDDDLKKDLIDTLSVNDELRKRITKKELVNIIEDIIRN